MAEAQFESALEQQFIELRTKLVAEHDALLGNALQELLLEVSTLHQEDLNSCRENGRAPLGAASGNSLRMPSEEKVLKAPNVSTHELPPLLSQGKDAGQHVEAATNISPEHKTNPNHSSEGDSPPVAMSLSPADARMRDKRNSGESAASLKGERSTAQILPAPPEAEMTTRPPDVPAKLMTGDYDLDFNRKPSESKLPPQRELELGQRELDDGSIHNSSSLKLQRPSPKQSYKARAAEADGNVRHSTITMAIPGCTQPVESAMKNTTCTEVGSEPSFTPVCAPATDDDDSKDRRRTYRQSERNTKKSMLSRLSSRVSTGKNLSRQSQHSTKSIKSSASSVFGRHQENSSLTAKFVPSWLRLSGYNENGRKCSSRVLPTSLLSVSSAPSGRSHASSVVPSLCGSAPVRSDFRCSKLSVRPSHHLPTLVPEASFGLSSIGSRPSERMAFLQTPSIGSHSDSANRIYLDGAPNTLSPFRSSCMSNMGMMSVESRFFMPDGNKQSGSNPPARTVSHLSADMNGHARFASNCGSILPNPIDEDFQFEVHQTWAKQQTMLMSATVTECHQDDDDEESEDEEDKMYQDSSTCDKALKRFTVTPMSKVRVIWDIFGCLFVAYDFVVTPLQFFDPPPSNLVYIINWMVRIFWSLDLPLSFMTAYSHPEGTTEWRPSKIIAKYARTWMPFDVTIITFDWFELLMQSDQGFKAARVGKTLKITRLLRMVRLLRLVRLIKMPELLSQFIYHLQSERLVIVIGIIKIMFFLVAVAHLIACSWYGIGTMNEDQNWIKQYDLEDANLEYKYVTSIHWSLTQFTGTMEVNPQNFPERFFTVLALLFGFLVSASVVSTITSSMTRLQIVSARQSTQVATLNQYLLDNGISTKVALRVQRNAVYAVSQEKRHTPESSIELLQFVSEPLRIELHYEIYSPILTWYPFFRHYDNANKQGMKRVCHGAVKRLSLSRGDVLFSAGEMPPCPVMYFVCTGKLQYQRQGFRAEIMLSGARACEVVLWTNWVHCGVLRSKIESNLLILDATAFQSISMQYQTSECYPKKFAHAFVKELNKCDKNTLTDLEHDDFNVEDVCMQIFRIKRSMAGFVSTAGGGFGINAGNPGHTVYCS